MTKAVKALSRMRRHKSGLSKDYLVTKPGHYRIAYFKNGGSKRNGTLQLIRQRTV